MVRVVPIVLVPTTRTLGLLAGRGVIEADVMEAFAVDIEVMFGGGR
jgi:hypothetical protein